MPRAFLVKKRKRSSSPSHHAFGNEKLRSIWNTEPTLVQTFPPPDPRYVISPKETSHSKLSTLLNRKIEEVFLFDSYKRMVGPYRIEEKDISLNNKAKHRAQNGVIGIGEKVAVPSAGPPPLLRSAFSRITPTDDANQKTTRDSENLTYTSVRHLSRDTRRYDSPEIPDKNSRGSSHDEFTSDFDSDRTHRPSLYEGIRPFINVPEYKIKLRKSASPHERVSPIDLSNSSIHCNNPGYPDGPDDVFIQSNESDGISKSVSPSDETNPRKQDRPSDRDHPLIAASFSQNPYMHPSLYYKYIYNNEVSRSPFMFPAPDNPQNINPYLLISPKSIFMSHNQSSKDYLPYRTVPSVRYGNYFEDLYLNKATRPPVPGLEYVTNKEGYVSQLSSTFPHDNRPISDREEPGHASTSIGSVNNANSVTSQPNENTSTMLTNSRPTFFAKDKPVREAHPIVPSLPVAMTTPHNGGRRNTSGKPPQPRKYVCDVCGKAFSRSNTLVTHKRIHTGDKPFSCELCGRAFRQPGNLTRHRLTHTTVKPYVCTQCGKAFNRASNLHTHMRTHTNYKPFTCTFCGKGFHQKIDMKIHSYTHTGEKPHKCKKCGRGFKQLTHLTYHMRTHSEERDLTDVTCVTKDLR